MVESLLLIYTQAPYGHYVPEDLSLFAGISLMGVKVTPLFTQDSVYIFAKDQRPEGIGVKPIASFMSELQDLGVEGFIVEEDLEERGLTREDLVEWIPLRYISRSEAANLILEHEASILL